MNLLVEKAYAAVTAPRLDFFMAAGTDANLGQLISVIITWVSIVAAAIAFFYLIYGGFMYLTAGGNEEGAKKGQQAIINAVIGLVIIALSWAVLSAVIGTIGQTS